MVSKHREVHHAKAGGLIAAPTPDPTAQASSLERELALLFGAELLAKAKVCRLSALDFAPMDIVAAARALRRLEGRPAAQQEMVAILPDDVQLALCRWLVDFRTPERVLAASGYRAH